LTIKSARMSSDSVVLTITSHPPTKLHYKILHWAINQAAAHPLVFWPHPSLWDLIRACWAEKPFSHPTMETVRSIKEWTLSPPFVYSSGRVISIETNGEWGQWYRDLMFELTSVSLTELLEQAREE
jgi:hypothetical protein